MNLWDRHGYETALRTQIKHGIADYCGIKKGVGAFVYESEDPERALPGVDSGRLITCMFPLCLGLFRCNQRRLAVFTAWR